MKIIKDGIIIRDVPLVKSDDGLSYLWLIAPTKTGITALYKRVFKIWRSPGIIHIELHNHQILLMQRKPFIYIENQEVIFED